ncbi:MAG: AAA family ATPase [Zetaproteobacteria bacterium]|nr:AAA family ATPase [Zetaproteobacteria bacterium]
MHVTEPNSSSTPTAQEQVLEREVQLFQQWTKSIEQECAKKIVGQSSLLRRLIMALIGQGHILLEGLPGLAKTTSIKTLASTTGLRFKRIQFTPDLLPADVLGTQIFDPKTTDFKVKQGPIFSNLILADEINRAPAKVQSALLEAMEEQQVTIGKETFSLEKPFMVMATQNPIEQEGTYPLPEAQLDRFLFKVKLDYPSLEEEVQIIALANKQIQAPTIQNIANSAQILHWKSLVHQIYVDKRIHQYIVGIVHASRKPSAFGVTQLSEFVYCGASPRASLALDLAARLNAMYQGRTYVIPADIKDVAHDILRHRILLSYEAEAASQSVEDVIQTLLDNVDIP